MDDFPVVARIAEKGHSLVILLPSGQRMALDPGQDLQSLTAENLSAGATGLTPTEKLISAVDSQWLAQASGPVWAENAAADSCGLVFTALDGSMRRVVVTNLPPGPLASIDQLIAVLERTIADSARTAGLDGGPG